jgi:hypothetical protein
MFELTVIGFSVVSFIIIRTLIQDWTEKEIVRRAIAKTRTAPNKSRFTCGEDNAHPRPTLDHSNN